MTEEEEEKKAATKAWNCWLYVVIGYNFKQYRNNAIIHMSLSRSVFLMCVSVCLVFFLSSVIPMRIM